MRNRIRGWRGVWTRALSSAAVVGAVVGCYMAVVRIFEMILGRALIATAGGADH